MGVRFCHAKARLYNKSLFYRSGRKEPKLMGGVDRRKAKGKEFFCSLKKDDQ